MIRVRGRRRRARRRGIAAVAAALMLTGLAIPAGADDGDVPAPEPVQSPVELAPGDDDDLGVGADDDGAPESADEDVPGEDGDDDTPPPPAEDLAPAPQSLETLDADDPDTQIITVDGIVRTIIEDGSRSFAERTSYVVDVDGVLLRVPSATPEGLSDRQPVSVTIVAPVGMNAADALASAGGAVPGDEAHVLAVDPAGDAPVRSRPDNPDGHHTVTFLPINWADSPSEYYPGYTEQIAEILFDHLAAVEYTSSGRLTSSITVRDPLTLPGSPTCDYVRQYNAAMHAAAEPPPADARAHVVVRPRTGGMSCSTSAAVLGGSQIWLGDSGQLGTTFRKGFGRNLGLGDSGTRARCGPHGVIDLDAECTSNVASDGRSIMGSSTLGLVDAHAEALGWGDSVTATPDAVLSASLASNGRLSTGRALRIPMQDGSHLYVERDPYYNVVQVRQLTWTQGVPFTMRLAEIYSGSVWLIEGSDYAVSLDGSSPPVVRVVHRDLDTTPPTAPVITEPTSDGGVGRHGSMIRWDPATDDGVGVVGYRLWMNDRLERDVAGLSIFADFSGEATSDGNSRRGVITLAAMDAAGNMTVGEPLSVRREGVPFPPTDLVLETGYASVHASWNDAETYPNATYRAEVYRAGNEYVRVLANSVTRTSSTFHLPPSSAWEYVIRGSNSFGSGLTASARFVIEPPTVTAHAEPRRGLGPITVSWNVTETSAPPPASIRVLVDGEVALTLPGGATSAELPTPPPGTHSIVVHAVDPWGDKVASEPVTVTVPVLAITTPRGSATSPVELTWQLHPTWAQGVTGRHFVIMIDGFPTRRVSWGTRSTVLPLRPGISVISIGTSSDVRYQPLVLDAIELDVTSAGPLFTDVPLTHSFADDIFWLAQSGVTTGYSDGSFQPTRAVTRGQMAAFLYRYASADLTGHTPPTRVRFADVPASHSFHTEISWLAESGVTSGYADGSFRPNRTITRAEMAAFLYRFREAHREPPSRAPFPDVPASHTFATEIAWLSETGITTGYTDGTFRPRVSVTRAAMAAYLHRMQGGDRV